jgi:hypothetical protein
MLNIEVWTIWTILLHLVKITWLQCMHFVLILVADAGGRRRYHKISYSLPLSTFHEGEIPWLRKTRKGVLVSALTVSVYIELDIMNLVLWPCASFYFAGGCKLTIQCQHWCCQTTSPNGGCFLCRGAYASGLNHLLYSHAMAQIAATQLWTKMVQVSWYINHVLQCDPDFRLLLVFNHWKHVILFFLAPLLSLRINY